MKYTKLLTMGLVGLISGCYENVPNLRKIDNNTPDTIDRIEFLDDFVDDNDSTPEDVPSDVIEYCDPENALVKPITGETYKTGCVGVQNLVMERPEEYSGIGALFYTGECEDEVEFFHHTTMREVYIDSTPVFIDNGLFNRTPCEPEDSPDDYFWFKMNPERVEDVEINQSIITFDLYIRTEEERNNGDFSSIPFKGQIYCQDKDSCNGMIIR